LLFGSIWPGLLLIQQDFHFVGFLLADDYNRLRFMPHIADLPPAQLAHFRRKLLRWYSQNKRDLPWRKTRDPYRIWISEIMLQQTRVAAVVEHYQEFLRRFPTVRKLAAAREASVLAAWSGLGYYRRARNLHVAAKRIVHQHAGILPTGANKWRELPGIGRYTAAAIASIAFAEPVAVLDGNVERVVHRIAGTLQTKTEAWSSAQRLLDPGSPGDFNQAMMELGATVCLPRDPHCPLCPIRKFCRTQGIGSLRSTKPALQKHAIAYALDTRAGSVRMVRRSLRVGLMPGMWELPQVRPHKSHAILFSLAHSITTSRFAVTVVSGAARGRWVPVARLKALPLTGLARKILRTVGII